MMQQVKPDLRPDEKKPEDTITVRLDADLNEKFGDKLKEDLGAKRGKKSPALVAWIEEYVHGKREAPDIIPGLRPHERNLFAQLLDLYREDKESTKPLLESWVKKRK